MRDDTDLVLRLKRRIKSRKLRRKLVHAGKLVLKCLPNSLLYKIQFQQLRHKLPYSEIRPGDIVVQVGAPHDLMPLGRSRAINFGYAVGEKGTVVVVEPVGQSTACLKNVTDELGIADRYRIFRCGAWSEKAELEIMVHPDNAAANALVEANKNNAKGVDAMFDTETVSVDTLDSILLKAECDFPIKLVSITTNGSEQNILSGLLNTLDRGVDYISIAQFTPDLSESNELVKRLAELKFAPIAADDRGYTFSRVD